MRICWFDDNKLGLVEGDMVSDVSAALKVLPTPQYPAPNGDMLIANLDRVRAEIVKVAPGAKKVPASSVRFLSPVANPSKIIGVPVNYLKHVEEAKEQLHVFTARHQGTIEEAGLFLKSTSSLIGAGETVKLRFPDRRSDHEMEVGVIIGKVADRVSEADALEYVAGYCIALDMVVRGSEDRSFRKSIDTYSVAGPWMVTADEIPDPGHL
ncbi:MAG TPA: fumarylacetoacetate hydrolase family protein, partial [Xanthobacteraceae bacterium]|nr:fumarylacetoacetate hydrolase family protein [Xanthobacteraceae bacterium]